MLSYNPSEPEYLLLTCVEGHKSGHSLALVKSILGNPYAINGASIKHSMGIENVFMIN